MLRGRRISFAWQWIQPSAASLLMFSISEPSIQMLSEYCTCLRCSSVSSVSKSQVICTDFPGRKQWVGLSQSILSIFFLSFLVPFLFFFLPITIIVITAFKQAALSLPETRSRRMWCHRLQCSFPS